MPVPDNIMTKVAEQLQELGDSSGISTDRQDWHWSVQKHSSPEQTKEGLQESFVMGRLIDVWS